MTRQQRDRQRTDARAGREAKRATVRCLLQERIAAWRSVEKIDFDVALLPDKEIAAKAGVSRRTLSRWKQQDWLAGAIAEERTRNLAADASGRFAHRFGRRYEHWHARWR
jgi:hypothetical protein